MTALPSPFNRYSLLKQIPVFGKFGWIKLQQIARKSTIEEYEKGELICKQEDPPDAFYCLISGRIQAYSLDEDGKKSNVEFIRRGMHFGIVSLLAEKTHYLNFEAINDSVVLKIDKDDFYDILKSVPQLGVELSQSLSKKIRRRPSEAKSTFKSTIISTYSPTKGSGCSTYAINLALSLKREAHKDVILVNIQPASNPDHESSSDEKKATPLWKKQGVGLGDISGDYEKIIHSISTKQLQVNLLNVIFDPSDADLVDQISKLVTVLASDYHYVVVDLLSQMNDVVLKTLVQSDIVHLVTLDRKDDLVITKQVIDELEEELSENFDETKIQVITNDPQATYNLSFEEVNREIDFDVSMKLPYIQSSELTVSIDSDEISVMIPQPKSAYAVSVTRIARKISGNLVGLVLGGGAALGLAHIGVLRVLEREDIPIDIVVGSSVGALLSSLWVTGKNADDIEHLAREFKNPRDLIKLIDPVLPISGLIGGRSIKKWLKKRHLGDKTFYNTRIPFKIVAYDLIKRREIVIESGLLSEAVQKSIAIPGVFSPIIERGKLIIDGGVLNPLPTNVLVSRGIKKIIAVNVLQSPEVVTKGYIAEQQYLKKESRVPFFKAPLRYIKFRLGKLAKKLFTPSIPDIIIRSLQASEYTIAEQSAKQASVVICPDMVGINWFELHKVDELIKRGEEAARRALPEIKQLVKG